MGTTRSGLTTSTSSTPSNRLHPIDLVIYKASNGSTRALLHGNFEPIDEAWLPQVTFAFTQTLTTKALLVPGYLVIAKASKPIQIKPIKPSNRLTFKFWCNRTDPMN